VGDGIIQWSGYKVVEPKRRYITDVSNVYENPNETSRISYVFEKGLEVDTQKINDNWVYAKDINNRSGFVKKEFITNKTPN
jgi:SH3-like domain-containing protein